MDSNGDGYISLTEFKDGLREHRGLFSGGVRKLEEAFAEIDHDSSGKISVSEFIAATLDSQAEWLDQVLWDAFRALDTDASGHVSPTELREAIISVESRLGREHAALIAQRLDGELVRSLTFRRFKELLKEEGGRSGPVLWDPRQLLGMLRALPGSTCSRFERGCCCEVL